MRIMLMSFSACFSARFGIFEVSALRSCLFGRRADDCAPCWVPAGHRPYSKADSFVGWRAVASFSLSTSRAYLILLVFFFTFSLLTRLNAFAPQDQRWDLNSIHTNWIF